LAETWPEKCCEKVSREGNVANKDFAISQKYAACKNWFTRHILWLRAAALIGHYVGSGTK
jgi:hypothetical protein